MFISINYGSAQTLIKRTFRLDGGRAVRHRGVVDVMELEAVCEQLAKLQCNNTVTSACRSAVWKMMKTGNHERACRAPSPLPSPPRPRCSLISDENVKWPAGGSYVAWWRWISANALHPSVYLLTYLCTLRCINGPNKAECTQWPRGSTMRAFRQSSLTRW